MARPIKEFLYGLNPIFEALRDGRRTFHCAYMSDTSAQNGRQQKLKERFERDGIPIEWCDKGRLHQICGAKEHQGVVVSADLYPYSSHEEIFESGAKRIMLLDNVEDPHNVGAILRSAEVFGFDHALLPIKGVPEVYPSVAKVSSGATEHMLIAKDCNSNRYVQQARENGYTVAALDAKGKVALNTFAESPPEKLLLVIGGEDKSVGQYILNDADAILSVPQSGKVNSLNASVAAGLAMYELRLR
jgi:23S rRNA (guanosine2251-2'-O)-methyltransferase|tara:strand:+ start:275 stop:1009 length:735 start_codon:yes stop_codon:yes gene_type:complete